MNEEIINTIYKTEDPLWDVYSDIRTLDNSERGIRCLRLWWKIKVNLSDMIDILKEEK